MIRDLSNTHDDNSSTVDNDNGGLVGQRSDPWCPMTDCVIKRLVNLIAVSSLTRTCIKVSRLVVVCPLILIQRAELVNVLTSASVAVVIKSKHFFFISYDSHSVA